MRNDFDGFNCDPVKHLLKCGVLSTSAAAAADGGGASPTSSNNMKAETSSASNPHLKELAAHIKRRSERLRRVYNWTAAPTSVQLQAMPWCYWWDGGRSEEWQQMNTVDVQDATLMPLRQSLQRQLSKNVGAATRAAATGCNSETSIADADTAGDADADSDATAVDDILYCSMVSCVSSGGLFLFVLVASSFVGYASEVRHLLR